MKIGFLHFWHLSVKSFNRFSPQNWNAAPGAPAACQDFVLFSLRPWPANKCILRILSMPKSVTGQISRDNYVAVAETFLPHFRHACVRFIPKPNLIKSENAIQSELPSANGQLFRSTALLFAGQKIKK